SVLENNNVTLSSHVSGGTGSYSYSWSGTDMGTVTGDYPSLNAGFGIAGTKYINLTVTSGAQTVSASCTIVVMAPTSVLPWTAPSSVTLGSPLSYTLHWNGGPMESSWEVFVHFVKSDGTTV